MHKADTARAFAWVEQWMIRGGFRSTDSANSFKKRKEEHGYVQRHQVSHGLRKKPLPSSSIVYTNVLSI